MDLEHGDGDSSKHSNQTEIPNSETEPKTQKKYLTNFSPSSSQDLIEMDILTNQFQNSKQDGLIESPEITKQTPSQSFYEMPTSSYPSGYDPNRIPSSVFASKPTTPMEWSVASNESLFSIQMGNNSFSRDNIFMLYKSGELPRLDDSVRQNNYKHDEGIMASKIDEPVRIQPSLPTVIEGDLLMDQKSTEEEAGNESKIIQEDQLEEGNGEQNHNEGKISVPSAEEIRPSPRSDGSMNSVKSFAFPVLESEGRNNSIKVDVQETDEEKQPAPATTASPPEQPSKQTQEEKVESPTQSRQPEQTTPQTPKPTPKAGANSGWFSCFSCFSGCC